VIPALALAAALAAACGPDGVRSERRVLGVGDLGRASEHYVAIGFRVVRRGSDEVVLGVRGGVQLVLSRREEDCARPEDAAVVVPVQSVASERRRLEARGVAFEALIARPSGRISLRVVDPDRNRVVFRSRQDVGGRAGVPDSGDLNPLVVEVLRGYADDGAHKYHWPKTGGWKGNTKDLVYGDQLLAAGDPDGRCYCCGLTFEVFLDAWRLWTLRRGRSWQIVDFDLDRVRLLHQQWFGSAADKTCVRTALVDNGLGHEVLDWEDAKPGDFVQLWRANGSGHSVVFLAWVRGADGAIEGIRYWSTQGSTQGIGERTESFLDSAGERRVLRSAFYLCRVGLEPHRADRSRRGG
jgi:hypothetical protein